MEVITAPGLVYWVRCALTGEILMVKSTQMLAELQHAA